MFRTLRRTLLDKVLPENLSKILRCIGAPNKFLHFPKPTYFHDEMATRANADFMRDPRFAAAFERGMATGAWRNVEPKWRAWVCCWAASKGARLQGDFVECGVYKGGFSATLAHYVDFNSLDKNFWLLDTYGGMSEAHMSDAERAKGLSLSKASYESDFLADAQATFADYPRARLVQGTVPETLGQVQCEKVAYLSIDMNCAAPEIAAAEFFWPKLSRGAVIVLDDYGWGGHEEQKAAFDRFAEERGVMVLGLPTGQGLILKP